jgi:hypothetical protein
MRHKRCRKLLSELGSATRWEKIVLFIPFAVLIVDAEIFYYSLLHHEEIIILASGFVLFLSIIEIIAALQDIHVYVSSSVRQTGLEEIIRETIQEMGDPVVKEVVKKVRQRYPDEGYGRDEIYHLVCRILDEKKY